jgi:hypothetical protein
MAASVKMRAFWDIAPYSLDGVDRRVSLKCRSTLMRLHSAIPQKALIFNTGTVLI